MVKELELFGLDGASGWFARTKKPFHLQPGQRCRNCDTELQGRYCHVCSQDADTHHRTLFHLIFEGFEGLFHLDGRLWQTLPPLFLNPGRLNRDLMDGRIARHVPPFRLFLVALLVFMFAAEHKTEEMRHQAQHAVHATSVARPVASDVHTSNSADTSEDADALTLGLSQVAERQGTVQTITHADGSVDTVRTVNVFGMSEEDAHYLAGVVAKSHLQPEWVKARIVKALNNPEGFFHNVFTWGHRLALLLLPIVGLSLGLLYRGKKDRRFFLYDHLLVGMNLLSFIFFLYALAFVLPEAVTPFVKPVLMLWVLVNFFRTLRGAYGSSIIGAALKSGLLWVMTLFSFMLVLAGVMLVSLTAS